VRHGATGSRLTDPVRPDGLAEPSPPRPDPAPGPAEPPHLAEPPPALVESALVESALVEPPALAEPPSLAEPAPGPAAPPPLAGPPRLAGPPGPAAPPQLTEPPSAEPPPAGLSPRPDSGRAAVPAPPADDAGSPPAGRPGRRAGSRPARRHRAALAGRQPYGAAYLVVICGVALSLSYLWRGPQNVRGGALAVAVMLLAAAVARLVLPERRAGMLASRRRLVDVAAFSALGVALLVAGLVFPAQN
jgi:hypothetical protein